jgi:hypothetical protein
LSKKLFVRLLATIPHEIIENQKPREIGLPNQLVISKVTHNSCNFSPFWEKKLLLILSQGK